ncbi:MAG: tRNA lysidine(34) synthetase TilS [Coriobacteriia bacterium]|nr:tRNA lysidine(34) synthetase TilS [Coriobacteriia bacterium]
MDKLNKQVISTVKTWDMLPEPPAPLVLMVSGGADSVAMAYLMTELFADYDFTVLHVNHGLRAVAADQDEAFVANLASQLGLQFEARHIDLPAIQAADGGNIEDLGRQYRYAFAEKLLEGLEAQSGSVGCILTAHTADDQAETYLMRVIKGGGLDALASIPHVRAKIVRPLLDTTRADILAYLTNRKLSWQEDATNNDTDYFRAFVRHGLLPIMKKQNPRLIETINRNLRILVAESAFVEQSASPYYQDPLAAPDIALARRAIRHAFQEAGGETSALTFAHVEKLRLNGADEGFALDLPGRIRAINDGGRLVFALKEPDVEAAAYQGELKLGLGLQTPIGTITVNEVEREQFADDPLGFARRHAGADCLIVDADVLDEYGGSLMVSTLEKGDRFAPLGMDGRHKKVSDLLIDRKIPVAQRKKTLKLTVGGQIIWVIGVQADDRFKARPESKRLSSIIVGF